MTDELKRIDFIKLLKQAQPALSTKDFVPILTHFCLDGKTIVASNDIIAIEVPWKSSVVGAVRGPDILGLLENSLAKNLDISFSNGVMKIKAGNSLFKLPLLPEEDFIFEFPKGFKKWEKIETDDDFVLGLELCLIAASVDTSRPSHMGVTVVTGKETYLYSTDGHTISRYLLEDSWTAVDVILLPVEFCSNLIKLTKDFQGEEIILYVTEDNIVATIGEHYKLFSRLIVVDEPLDYASVIAHNVSEMEDYGTFNVPGGLLTALKRALIVVEQDATAGTAVVIEKERLKLNTASDRGDVSDNLKFEGGDVKSVTCKANPKHLIRAVDVGDEMGISESCLCFQIGSKFLHLISVQVPEESV